MLKSNVTDLTQQGKLLLTAYGKNTLRALDSKIEKEGEDIDVLFIDGDIGRGTHYRWIQTKYHGLRSFLDAKLGIGFESFGFLCFDNDQAWDSETLRVVTEVDGYQPHLVALEQGYIRLIERSVGYFKGPVKAYVDVVILDQSLISGLCFIPEWYGYAMHYADIISKEG
ncbi:hypothetical protein VNO78_10709 [Psophocarpus tetragonolobus]|uniref:Uncharacterized protein n=1 Tax=Psophocarpus tetragonolobus TaxID=3891 RepID=A0AAN9SK73_PSOTE